MKPFLGGLAIATAILPAQADAQVTLVVNGNEYELTDLIARCQSMDADPAAQISCFNAVSTLLEEQTGSAEIPEALPAAEALNKLRGLAEYEDSETGLMIRGAECTAQIIYYGNYFHVSRRNVSSLDLFSVQFDASDVAPGGIDKTGGQQAFLSRGTMRPGAVASAIGGVGLSSAQFDFAPRSPRATLAEYAVEVVDQLPPEDSSAFDFVLVHPAKQQASDEIWAAFDTYLAACQNQK